MRLLAHVISSVNAVSRPNSLRVISTIDASEPCIATSYMYTTSHLTGVCDYVTSTNLAVI